MKLNVYFYGWLTCLLLFLGGLYFSFEAGFLSFVWSIDASKLSFIILFLFFFAYFRLGYFLYQENYTSENLDPGYEIADISMALGMLGTVIGFIIMTTSFTLVDFSNVENVKNLFALATEGMSTALYTTVFGLTSSIILRTFHYIAERRIKCEED